MSGITLGDVQVFQRPISAISSFITEGNFRLSKEGLSLKAIDPSQIVLVNFELPKKAFEKYDLEPTFIGVDLVELNRIMQRALSADSISLKISENEMEISLEGEMLRTFRLSLIDISEDEVTVPATKFDASIEAKAKIIKELLKDASLFGSSVVLRVKGNEFCVEARGSQGTLKTLSKESAKVSSKTQKETVSKYSLSFLQNIMKEADNDSSVLLELKTDSPLKVSYSVGEARLEFYLAHMIL